MDNKESQLIKNYKEKFTSNTFNEFDIYGFLILIRRHIKNNSPLIGEFCDLVAHRVRDRGIIMNAICEMVEKRRKHNTVFIDNTQWQKEWKNLSKKFNLNLTQRNIDEITMCIYSLASNTIYNNKNNNYYRKKHIGYVRLLIDVNNNIYIGITSGRKKSKFIAFAKYKCCINNIEQQNLIINNLLLIRDEEGYLSNKGSD